MEAPYSWLDQVTWPSDLRELPQSVLPELARELRGDLLRSLDTAGGHLSANLGAVELAVALHYVFQTPGDRLIWDTGHQAYPHKVLTGRRAELAGIRGHGGLAPFPHRGESPFDAFGTGHCGTALSAALGMALSIANKEKSPSVVAIIGDGGLTTGLTFEALSHLAEVRADVLIILNDNGFSISPTVGGLSRRTSILTHWGFDCRGPIDGHDLNQLVVALRELRKLKGPRILHVATQKGKGYPPAELDPARFHAVSSGFLRGEVPAPHPKTFSQVFGEWACRAAARDDRLVVLTPAMKDGSGLAEFSRRFPERFHDVGIAEPHAMTLAAGLAAHGSKPVLAIYSTFLQRAYDQWIHDVALQKLPVLLAVDRAGIVGSDGQTHGGLFDLSFLGCIPNSVIMAPADEAECARMLDFGFGLSQPAVVRYPRRAAVEALDAPASPDLALGRSRTLRKGRKIAILSFGAMAAASLKAAEALGATMIDMRFITPLDTEIIHWACRHHRLVVTVEENVLAGGAGSAVNRVVLETDSPPSVLNLGLPDVFVEHGPVDVLLARYGLDAAGITAAIARKRSSGR